jgi:hypothetical protein
MKTIKWSASLMLAVVIVFIVSGWAPNRVDQISSVRSEEMINAFKVSLF